MAKNNIQSLEQKKSDRKAEMDELAKRYAEAMCEDNPSQETKSWFQARLGRDPEEWRRHGDLMKEALDRALEKFWLGYVTSESVKHGAEMLKAELGLKMLHLLKNY
jgi:hypothetical protein